MPCVPRGYVVVGVEIVVVGSEVEAGIEVGVVDVGVFELVVLVGVVEVGVVDLVGVVVGCCAF